MAKKKIYMTWGGLFVLAAAVNFVWEKFHAVLYLHYKGGPIYDWILLRASFVDAALITATIFLLERSGKTRSKPWLVALALIVIAVGLEWWALGMNRWEYGPAMPLVPLLHTGVTPTVQLAITGYVLYRIFFRRSLMQGNP